jgi:hypothetical protein
MERVLMITLGPPDVKILEKVEKCYKYFEQSDRFVTIRQDTDTDAPAAVLNDNLDVTVYLRSVEDLRARIGLDYDTGIKCAS